MEKEYMDYVIGKTIPVGSSGDVDSQCEMDGRCDWVYVQEYDGTSRAAYYWNEALIPEGLIEDSE